MLPLELWDISSWYLDEPAMGLYIQLSQVNRAFRLYFMGDWAWRRFDIHNVRGSGVRYKFGNYSLGGVPGHYLSFISTLEPERQAWHLNRNVVVDKSSWDNLYDDLNKLCTVGERSFDTYVKAEYVHHPLDHDKEASIVSTLRKQREEAICVPKAVYELFLGYPRYTKWDFRAKWDFRTFWHILDHKLLCIAWLSCIKYPGLPSNFHEVYGYHDDYEVNMALVKCGLYKHCSTQFHTNKQFLLETLHWSMAHFGRFDLFFEPSFLDQVLACNPGLLDYMANNYGLVAHNHVCLAPLGFNRLSEVFRSHARYVVAIVTCEPMQLEHASPELRDNEHVVAAAVKRNPDCLKYASERLRDDKDLVRWATSLDPNKRPIFFASCGKGQSWIEYVDRVLTTLPYRGQQNELHSFYGL